MANHCTHEQSQALKEIEFDMPVRDYYYKGEGQPIMNMFYRNYISHDIKTPAPTRSEVLQWAREKHGIDAWVESIYDFDNVKKYIFIIHKHDDSLIRKPTHPEAESALVDKLITILEEQKA